MTSIYNHIEATEDVTFILDTETHQGYQLAFPMEDGELWIKNITIDLTDRFVQRDISKYTEGQAYTVMPAQGQTPNSVILVMVARDQKIVNEITFKKTNLARNNFFKHLKVSKNPV